MKNETRPIPKKLMAKLFAVFLLFGIAFSLFAVAVGGSGHSMSDIYRAQALSEQAAQDASDMSCKEAGKLLQDTTKIGSWDQTADIAGMKYRCDSGELLSSMDINVITFYADDRPEDQVQKDLTEIINFSFQDQSNE